MSDAEVDAAIMTDPDVRPTDQVFWKGKGSIRHVATGKAL
jgi:hypothetical protein